ncbi:hypothetical protein Tco_0663147 [Tanacetum coccineum]
MTKKQLIPEVEEGEGSEQPTKPQPTPSPTQPSVGDQPHVTESLSGPDNTHSPSMNLEEHEKYTVDERAKLLAEYFENKKKQLAKEIAVAIKNKPLTKSQLRSLMMTYLKHTGIYKHAQLNKKTLEEIQVLYIKEHERIADFVPIGLKEDEILIQKMNKKVAGVQEEKVLEELDSTKVEVKQEENKESTRKRPEDELWQNQERWNLKSWNFYENCGVHTLTLEDGTEIHMLAERKYPLTKETLERMMSLKLIAESASESAYNLLRFIQKQIDEYGSYDGSEKDL